MILVLLVVMLLGLPALCQALGQKGNSGIASEPHLHILSSGVVSRKAS